MELQIAGLAVKVAKRTLLSEINFQAQSGDLVAFIGPSGCGKTTLLNTLGLLLPAGQGTIFYDGDDAGKWRKRRIRRFWAEKASFVIQDAGIDEDESVIYNVTLKKKLLCARRVDQVAIDALAKVSLEQRASESAGVLSGGEQRRLAIARAMYRQSKIIFADEPTASLDQQNRSLVQSLLMHEAKRGALVLVATHDLELAQNCNKILDLGNYLQN